MVKNYEIRNWMDKQVEAYHMSSERLLDVNDDGDYIANIGIHDRGIHIGGDAVRFIAEKLKLDLCVKSRKIDTDNPYEVFVIYKGESFFGIESEAEYRERGAVV